ncbi:MAG: symmetrical bis(5'-nucleosyl)-tetraphosphatase [Xanthomonadales bacterium]|nr:symmetrical bis(5'-nucleosyl)-tetraphosphatase [Xanthomonadales bacterium]
MSIYAIGDIQGFLEPLQRLLDKLRFDPAGDRLWFCGDLVNRGGASLEVLRLVRDLGSSALVVLGNHDLHLLAQWRKPPAKRKSNPEFKTIFEAPDGDELLDWLRRRPLLHVDDQKQAALVHAGIAPDWTPAKARQLAGEVESALRGDRFDELLEQMYGKQPDRFDPGFTGPVRWRTILAVLTRMRCCDRDGHIAFGAKGPPGTQPDGFYPWYEVPDRTAWPHTIFFGHWSALGLYRDSGVVGLDTGYVWGGALTAVDVQDTRRVFQVEASD